MELLSGFGARIVAPFFDEKNAFAFIKEIERTNDAITAEFVTMRGNETRTWESQVTRKKILPLPVLITNLIGKF